MTIKTRGRMAPFACGHKGFGVLCHRCEQANQIEVRSNELAQLLKTKGSKLPEFVTVTQVNGTQVSIRGGGRSWSAEVTGKKSQESVIAELIHLTREYATHLKNRSDQKTKQFVNP